MVKCSINGYLSGQIYVLAAVALLWGAVAQALENCTCRLDDVRCRPITFLSPNPQRTQLGIGWVYERNRCHDFYIIRYGVVGHALQQKDIKNTPHPCVGDGYGGFNCGYDLNINKDKPYVVMVNACTSSVFEGSSCTGWSEPAYWLPYGPDTCKDGFVWREAFLGDHVCVTKESKDKASAENRNAATRVQPGGGHSGPDTCKPPFVWREADRSADTQGRDHVCVTSDRRGEVWAENAAARNNKARP